LTLERLEIHPGGLAGEFRPPGDKSVTHRAYLLALLSEGETRVENPNPGADCENTLACACSLGLAAAREDGAVRLEGRGFALLEPDRVLDCGNSGTTLRLLAGVLAAQDFLAVLAGDASLHRRPVARVIEPLRRMGATLRARDGDRLPPLVVRGGRLEPIDHALPVASAQVATCVLLAGLQTAGVTTVRLPGPARDHTERMLASLGVDLAVEEQASGGRTVRLRGPVRLRGARWRVPGDFSSAAFLFAAAAARPGARITARAVGLNPTRSALLDVLEAMGATVERRRLADEASEEIADVTVTGPERLRGFDVPPEWMPRMIDEVPAWTIAAAAAGGVSRVRGAAELRVKESDRIAALVGNLARLGVRGA
jgi:3-phosphoshikimate 1-carboxyvinyltransferase